MLRKQPLLILLFFTCSAAVILLFRPLLFREESTFFNSLGSKNGLKRAIRPDRTAVG